MFRLRDRHGARENFTVVFLIQILVSTIPQLIFVSCAGYNIQCHLKYRTACNFEGFYSWEAHIVTGTAWSLGLPSGSSNMYDREISPRFAEILSNALNVLVNPELGSRSSPAMKRNILEPKDPRICISQRSLALFQSISDRVSGPAFIFEPR